MSHSIDVRMGANIDKYEEGMQRAKRVGAETQGTLSGIFSKIKQMFSGLWDSLKSFFSGAGDKFKGTFSTMGDSASGAFQKIAGYLPGFHSDLDKTKEKMGETEEKSTSLATKIVVGLVAAIVAATAVVGAFVKKGLEADAALASISISTDIAASKIARFEDAAARSGMGVNELGTSMGKLQAEMKKAAASEDSTVFDKLGVKVADSNHVLRDTDAVMVEVAQKIAGMSSEAEKYQAAAKVGFEGKVQALEDIAHAHDLVSTKTDEQAGAVVRLGKIWHEILPGGKSMWSKISDFLTTNLTPAMTDASISILKSKSTIVDAFEQIYGGGTALDKLGEKIRSWSKDVSGWFAGVEKSSTDMTVSIMKFIAEKTGLGDASSYKPNAGYVPPPVKLTTDNKDPVTTEAEKKAKEQLDQTNKSVAERIAIMRKQIEVGEVLTEGQRIALQLDKLKLNLDPEKFAAAQKEAATLDELEKKFKSQQDAKAAALAASKKEEDAYAKLISAIVTQTEETKVAIATGENATASQKNQIKFEQQLAAGKLTTASASYKVVKGLLAQQAVQDELYKRDLAQRDVTKYIGESALAREKMSEALQVEYSMYGKSADARAMAMVSIDAEIWRKKELLDLEAKKLPITQETLSRLEAEKQLRIQVGQALTGQGRALQYAYDLEQDNKRYAAEQITDAGASKRALLQIDVDLWQERIKNAGDGTEAQMRLQWSYDQWYANRVAELDPWYGLQRAVKEYGREASDVGSQIGNSMTNAFRGAEDAFANFVTTGKLNFRDLATSIIADMARIQAKQAISGIASAIGAALTSSFDFSTAASAANFNFAPTAVSIDTSKFADLGDLPHRANGGPVVGGASYVVGEHGEEVFTPSGNGTITPNHALGGEGAPITIQTNISIDSNGGSTSSSSGDQGAAGKALAEMIAAGAKDVIVRESRQGGLIWKMKMGRA